MNQIMDEFYGAHVVYCGESMNDLPGLDPRPHIASACAFLVSAHTAGGVALVHCQAGISRSATLVAAYLMHRERLTAASALHSPSFCTLPITSIEQRSSVL